MATKKLWGGRFSQDVDPVMREYNQSIKYDKLMFLEDLNGSIAYANALNRAGILTTYELGEITRGLNLIKLEWQSKSFEIKDNDEDIHTANERRLSELIDSSIAGKLHTGRSRNDQVATDMRYWLTSKVANDLIPLFDNLINVIVSRAELEIDHIMPGYTHLQRAQPIRWSHWLLSYAFFLFDDLERLLQVKRRINRLPLGSGALAGNPYPGIDRYKIAKDIGFNGLLNNSLQAVSDRDFVVEFLHISSLFMIHISRMAEDLILYSSAEFGFVKLSDAYSTGSSLMPQKKNADSLELLRGKSGRVFGQMAGFMMTLKGIPSTYNKDLQEDKEPLFDSVKTLEDSIKILTGVIAQLTIFPKKMQNALTMDMLATDLADYCVNKGIPFRSAHHICGQAVNFAEQKNLQGIHQLTLEDLKSINSIFQNDVFHIFDFEASIEKRSVYGGTARSSVLAQIDTIKQDMKRLMDS